MVLPASVKVTIIWADRAHMNIVSPVATVYGMDRFVEVCGARARARAVWANDVAPRAVLSQGGLSQITEHLITQPIKPDASSPCAKFKGEDGLWEYHLRFMSTPATLAKVVELSPQIWG